MPPVATLSTPQPARCATPRVKAKRLTYLIFARPDLTRAVSFLTDFGLIVAQQDDDIVYLRGTGPAPYCYRVHHAAQPRFLGFGLEVAARGDLETLARLPGASSIAPAQGPAGGEMVVLHDPAGFRIEAIFGQKAAPPQPQRAPLVLNSPAAHPRVNATQRLPAAPSEIVGLGHVVLEAVDYQATAAFYTGTFGFIPSDVQVLPDGSPIVAFMRLDLGGTPADHHTLALAQGVVNTYSHSAYEVADADAIGMGQRILARARLAPCLGHRASHPRQPDLRLLGRPLGRQARALLRWRPLHRRASDRRVRRQPPGDVAMGAAHAGALHQAGPVAAASSSRSSPMSAAAPTCPSPRSGRCSSCSAETMALLPLNNPQDF